MLSFRAVVAQCPAAATVGKARKTAGEDYVAYPTRKLFDRAERAGFKCVAALQGPSIKRAYVPFARHMLTFDRVDTAGEPFGVASSAPPRFRLVITNSHNGLTPMMFIPAVYVPMHDVTLFASAFAVFHRDFTSEVKFDELVSEAFDAAVAAEDKALLVWRKLGRASINPRQIHGMFRRVLNHHGGCTADVKAGQFDIPPAGGSSAGNVAAAILSGYTHGRFKSRTPSGRERGIYPSRAIVRIERAAFGAWYEACRHAYGNSAPNIELLPFNVTPLPKGEGVRRKSAPVIVTGKAAGEAAAD